MKKLFLLAGLTMGAIAIADQSSDEIDGAVQCKAKDSNSSLVVTISAHRRSIKVTGSDPSVEGLTRAIVTKSPEVGDTETTYYGKEKTKGGKGRIVEFSFNDQGDAICLGKGANQKCVALDCPSAPQD